MQIIARTTEPNGLINAIVKAINEGKLKTWEQTTNDKNEVLFRHSPDQWISVLIKPKALNNDEASFAINWWKKDGEPEFHKQGYVLGRFVEVLMVHFKDYFAYLTINK